MAIELGGNIVLEGFDGKDFTEMIVVKKIVGQYARQISDAHGSFKRLTVALTEKNGVFSMAATLVLDKEYTAEEAAHNLYVALDASLKNVMGQVA